MNTNKVKHTPGPWRATQTAPICTDTNTIPTNVVDCRTVSGYIAIVPHYTITNDTAEANARLIAAAPELLAALEKCAAALVYMFDDKSREGLSAARAAIAKAKSK